MLYLLPNVLSDQKEQVDYLPRILDQIVPRLDGVIAESEREARRFLKRFPLTRNGDTIPVAICNKNTDTKDSDFLLEPLVKGETWGLLADRGIPCIADPGSWLVKRAREKGIPIKAIAGPSSPVLALQLSGFSGQSFAFSGYLPKEEDEKIKKIKQLELRSYEEKAPQGFIETPYRNVQLIKTLLAQLKPTTELCVAFDLTGPHESVLRFSVEKWKQREFDKFITARGEEFVGNTPAIFYIQAKRGI